MYKLDASAYHEAIVILHGTIALVQSNPQWRYKGMTQSNANSTINQLKRLSIHVETLKCPIAKMAIDDVVKDLGGMQPDKEAGELRTILTYDNYGQLAINISKTLERELKLKLVFVIDPSRANYYNPIEPLFGRNIENQFPGLIADIDQAGKCYACDLNTASVFHTIRCLEAGIRAIARCLSISDPITGADRNWSNVSTVIRNEMEKKWPKSSGRISGDAAIFDQIYGSLSGMTNPYRNATMHLDKNYSASDAIHIMELVKGLMNHIASRMDENGQPLA
jgi:hypothetical protein